MATIEERLEQLKACLAGIEERLRAAEAKLRRYEYLAGGENVPSPLLKSAEDAYIRRLAGLSSLPLSNGENLAAFRESALRVINVLAGQELPGDLSDRAALIAKTLRSRNALSVRSLLYVTTQLIILLTSCASRLSEQDREEAVGELEVMVEIERRELP